MALSASDLHLAAAKNCPIRKLPTKASRSAVFSDVPTTLTAKLCHHPRLVFSTFSWTEHRYPKTLPNKGRSAPRRRPTQFRAGRTRAIDGLGKASRRHTPNLSRPSKVRNGKRRGEKRALVELPATRHHISKKNMVPMNQQDGQACASYFMLCYINV